MAQGPIVGADKTLVAATEAEFFLGQDQTIDEMHPVIAGLFAEAPQAKSSSQKWAGFESKPLWSRWPRGMSRKFKAFDDFQHEIVVDDWECGVLWHENDGEDDQIGRLVNNGNEAGEGYNEIPVRIAWQLLTGTADSDLLGNIPSAYDGNTFYLAATRFGVAAGNSIIGNGVISPIQIRRDIYRHLDLYRSYRDTTSVRRFWGHNKARLANMRFIVPSTLEEVFRAAIDTQITPAGLTTSANETNTIRQTMERNGIKLDDILYFDSLLTGDSWYSQLFDERRKPFIHLPRKPPRAIPITAENYESAMKTKIVGVAFDSRDGWGYGAPQSSIKNVNT